MGFIRGGLFVIASVLLFVLFLAGNTFLTLNLSLTYDNVQQELVSVIKDIVGDEMNLSEKIENDFEVMKLYCENNSEYVFSQEEHTFVIPCEIISEGSDAVIDYGINNLVNEVYYEEYDCNFWDCIKDTEAPFFLVSEKAKNYWGEKFYFSLLICLILIILMFFLIENKTNLLIVVGSLLIVSSLPFMRLNWVLSFINESLFGFFTIFFSKAHYVFLIVFILGLFVIGFGIILKFFKIGFKISEIANKFSKGKKNSSVNKSKEFVKKQIPKQK